MATADALRRTIPSIMDGADWPASLSAYSLSDPGIINVDSRTDAEARRTAYNNACTAAGITPGALTVFRKDLRNIEFHANVAGRTWEYAGGRRRGLTAKMERIVEPGQTRDLYVVDMIRESEGFTLSETNALVIVPQTGTWKFHLVGSFDGSDTSIVSSKLQITTGAGALIGVDSANGRQVAANGLWPLTQGEGIKGRVSHGAGGNATFTGTLQLQLDGGDPDW